MKQDLVPDLKSHQARKGVKTDCLEVQQAGCKRGEAVPGTETGASVAATGELMT